MPTDDDVFQRGAARAFYGLLRRRYPDREVWVGVLPDDHPLNQPPGTLTPAEERRYLRELIDRDRKRDLLEPLPY
jgi:hypothetical protein